MHHLASIADAVPVSPDGTLSRVLHRDDRVRLVAFSFDAGQELTEHTAALPVILQTMQGSLSVTASGETIRLVPGAWMALEGGEPHTVVALEPSVLLLTLLRAAETT